MFEQLEIFRENLAQVLVVFMVLSILISPLVLLMLFASRHQYLRMAVTVAVILLLITLLLTFAGV